MSVKKFIEKQEDNLIKDSLPGLTKIYQSKLLSEKIEKGLFHGFGTYHNRLYLYVLNSYQNHIKNAFFQTELNFNDSDANLLRIDVPLCEIGKARNSYKDIISAAKDIENLILSRTTYFENDSTEYQYDTPIFDTVYKPITINKRSILRIDIKKSLFNDLIHITLDPKTKKPLFTSFVYEVALNSDNKYLPKLYIFLSDWVNLGHRRISMKDLLVILGIDTNKHPSYIKPKYLNQKVMEPIKKELYAMCKFFFNYEVKKYKEQMDEYYYDFVILNREELLKFENSMNQIKKMLDNYEIGIYDDIQKYLEVHAQAYYSVDYLNLLVEVVYNCIVVFKKQHIEVKSEYIKKSIEQRFVENKDKK